jgi:hypothetical protein
MIRRMQHRWIAYLALIVVLFAQSAVAAYACPGLMLGTMNISNCEGMAAKANQTDPDNPNLCLHHCQQGEQTFEKVELITILSLLAISIVLILWTAAGRWSHLLLPPPFYLRRAIAPPLSIQNCCFRI